MAALRAWPATHVQRGQLLLVLLALLTAWALTLQQARTMDMSMGVVARSGIDSRRDSPPADIDSNTMADMGDMDDMASMPGMATETFRRAVWPRCQVSELRHGGNGVQ